MISKEDVKKLAELARIEVSEEEQVSLAKDMESILGYVSELSSVPGISEEMVLEENRNRFREDDNADPAGLYTDKILKDAPRTENGYILVKQVINEKGK